MQKARGDSPSSSALGLGRGAETQTSSDWVISDTGLAS